MAILQNLVINEVTDLVKSYTYTNSIITAANIPEFFTVPTDENGQKAGYVTFGLQLSANTYIRPFTLFESTDRVTNGTFAEYVTNGTFASDTGWTKGTGWTIAAGVATATGAINTTLSQTSAITLIAGHTYTLTYTVTAFTAGTITANVGGTAGTARSSAATFTETFVAGSTQILSFTTAGFTGSIDNVTVTAWVLGTGWTTDGTTAIATGAISTALSQTALPTFPIIEGQAYLVTYVATRSAGTVTVNVGGTAGTARSTSATFAEVIIAGSTQAISFTTSGFTGTVDNVTIVACASVPVDSTSGLSSILNPKGFALPSTASTISVINTGVTIVTASFYKR